MNFFPFTVYRVSGHSMEPNFKGGTIVVVSSLTTLKTKDVLVFKKGDKKFIKRVKEKTSGGFLVVGDNQSDSLEVGEVLETEVLGKVVFKFFSSVLR